MFQGFKVSRFLILLIVCFNITACYDEFNSSTEGDSTKKNRNYSYEYSLKSGISMESLAYHYAPVHYQDLYSVNGDHSRADYIARIDRDSSGVEGAEWNVFNNFDKKLRYPLKAYAYYSVVESKSHYFITYSFYHPWDTVVKYTPFLKFDAKKKDFTFPLALIFPGKTYKLLKKVKVPDDITVPYYIPKIAFRKKRVFEKKNDMEGFLFVVKKDSNFGVLEAVFSQAHGFMQVYLTSAGEQNLGALDGRKRMTIDRVFVLAASQSMGGDGVSRIITTQEHAGHGAGCYPDWGSPSPGNVLDPVKINKRHNNDSMFERIIEKQSGGDYICYIPTMDEAEEPNPNNKDGDGVIYCKYKLIDVFEPNGLWDNRYNPSVFNSGKKYSFQGGHGDPFWTWHGEKAGFSRHELDKMVDEYTQNANRKFDEELKKSSGVTADFTKEIVKVVKANVSSGIKLCNDDIKQMASAVSKLNFEIDSLEKAMQKTIEMISALNHSLAVIQNSIEISSGKVNEYSTKSKEKQTFISTLTIKLSKIPQFLTKKSWGKIGKKRWRWLFGWISKVVPNSEWFSLDTLIKSQKSELNVINNQVIVENEKITGLNVKMNKKKMQLNLLKDTLQMQENKFANLTFQKNSYLNRISESKSFLKEVTGSMRDDGIYNPEKIAGEKALRMTIDFTLKLSDKLIDVICLRYRYVEFTSYEKNFLIKEHRPWSHNPAHLCWIYLHGKFEDSTTYFSEVYESNNFMSDTMGGNFEYENGVSVPKY